MRNRTGIRPLIKNAPVVPDDEKLKEAKGKTKEAEIKLEAAENAVKNLEKQIEDLEKQVEQLTELMVQKEDNILELNQVIATLQANLQSSTTNTTS